MSILSRLLLSLLALRIQRVSAIFNIDIGSDIPQGEYEAPPSSSPTSQSERPYSSIDILSTPTGPNRGSGSNSADDCYKVMRNMMFNNEYNNPGCWTDRYYLEYYNGDLDEDYEETGYPKETYLDVTVEIIRDCTNSNTQRVADPDRCTISVSGLGQCNRCSFNSELQTVTMEDCSNLNRIFLEKDDDGNPQTMAASPTVVCPTPTTCRTLPQFFPLSSTSINGVGGSAERCDHPLWFGDTYAPTPTPSNHMKLKLDLTYSFRAGSGRQPTTQELYSLQRATQAFVQHSLNADPSFGTELVDDVQLHLLSDRYTTDEVLLEMDLTIVLDEDEPARQQQVSASRVNRLLSSSTSLHEYIVGYVRHLGRIERSIWYYVQNVHYRGVAF